MGGLDDGRLVVWDIAKRFDSTFNSSLPCALDTLCFFVFYWRMAICGGLAKNEITGAAYSLCSLNKLGALFLTCGERKCLQKSKYKIVSRNWKFFGHVILGHLRIWNIDITTNKLHVLNASLGKIRRNFTAMKISADDSVIFVGTTSGDVMKLRLNCRSDEFNRPTLIGCFGRHNPKKQPGKDCEKYMNGVRDLLICPNNERHLVIGAGDGTIELVEERNIVIKDYPSPTWPMFKAVNKLNKGVSVSASWTNCNFSNF